MAILKTRKTLLNNDFTVAFGYYHYALDTRQNWNDVIVKSTPMGAVTLDNGSAVYSGSGDNVTRIAYWQHPNCPTISQENPIQVITSGFYSSDSKTQTQLREMFDGIESSRQKDLDNQ